jgi:pimeloyl-ACP methyl ester carboxylesterase
MNISLKKISKKKKWILFIAIISIFYFFNNKGVTYKLPENTEVENSTRKIKTYLEDEFEWFLYTPDKVPLYVKEVGKGKTLVTLHGGFGMTHNYMRNFMKPFENKFHVVYYDQRGSNGSPVPDYNFEKYITLENMVNDLELLRRELKVNKLNLVAHSMGAFLAYEYMKKFPNNVNDVIIISGFVPKFPDNNAAFHDLFTSQLEREVFSNRKEISQEFTKLKQNIDTTSAEFLYLNYKINSSSTQIFDIKKWRYTVGGVGSFNPKINELIGPESHIPLLYGLKFYIKQKEFNKGTLDLLDRNKFKSPINYLPIIENHKGNIDYFLGTHEFGDWNLRLYKRYIKQTSKVKMHIFENAGHNIWIDKPQEFNLKLKQILLKTN